MKIGRNELCPCGSGRKYKRCCAGKPTTHQEAQAANFGAGRKVTLSGAIQEYQELARQKKTMVRQLGVFILFSDRYGDAWVLEVTDSDGIQIASAGEPIAIPLEENDETIVVDWSHTFSFRQKKLLVESYRKRESVVLQNAPVQEIFATRRKILKKLSPELLEQVHLNEAS